MPIPEARLWVALRQLRPRHHFRRQVQIGPYYADFLCHSAKLVIEVDGESHFVTSAQEYDQRRDSRIAADGFRILRIPNSEVMRNLDGVMDAVLCALGTPTLDPSPQGGGRR